MAGGVLGDKRGYPHGDKRERSSSVTDRKQLGRKKMSRKLPRRVREVRVERSRRSHLWQTKEAELRLRTSETAAIMMERITSGRSLMVVGVGEIAIEKEEIPEMEKIGW